MSRDIQLKYKGNRCAYCGMTVEEMVARYGTFKRMTEFHHIDENKKAKNYDKIIQRKLSSEQLNELDKCILLCRQCHGIAHAQDIKVTLKLKLDFQGKEYVQVIKGQMIYDLLDKKAKIFSEENNKLNIYQIRIGKERFEFMVGIEMDTMEFFSHLFRDLKNTKIFEIRNEDASKVMMKGEYLGNNEIEIKQAVEFPFLEYECKEENIKFWARNGQLIDSSGRIISDGTLTTRHEIVEII